jgi:hypothetical protein
LMQMTLHFSTEPFYWAIGWQNNIILVCFFRKGLPVPDHPSISDEQRNHPFDIVFSNFTLGCYARLRNNYSMCHRQVKTTRCVHGLLRSACSDGTLGHSFRNCSFVTLDQNDLDVQREEQMEKNL